MSASVGTIGAPRRAGMGPAARQVLQVVLVLAISIGAIVAFATLPELAASVDGRRTATGVSDLDARWTPKWSAAAEVTTADEGSTGDTRWTVKMGRAEAAARHDWSEARGSGGG